VFDGARASRRGCVTAKTAASKQSSREKKHAARHATRKHGTTHEHAASACRYRNVGGEPGGSDTEYPRQFGTDSGGKFYDGIGEWQ